MQEVLLAIIHELANRKALYREMDCLQTIKTRRYVHPGADLLGRDASGGENELANRKTSIAISAVTEGGWAPFMLVVTFGAIAADHTVATFPTPAG